jgi:hypothetical protein
MQGPNGERGVQAAPNKGQALGLIFPFNTAPQQHCAGCRAISGEAIDIPYFLAASKRS